MLHCLSKKVTFFDSPPLYGDGLSGRSLGGALTSVPANQIVVESKIGVVVNPNGTTTRSYARDMVLCSVEDSLKRLRIDYLDTCLIHDADSHFRAALDEAYPALVESKSEGIIRGV